MLLKERHNNRPKHIIIVTLSVVKIAINDHKIRDQPLCLSDHPTAPTKAITFKQTILGKAFTFPPEYANHSVSRAQIQPGLITEKYPGPQSTGPAYVTASAGNYCISMAMVEYLTNVRSPSFKRLSIMAEAINDCLTVNCHIIGRTCSRFKTIAQMR